jgi:glucose-1-phosphate thymidylyltransferase
MRRAEPGARIDPEQRRVADTGMKGMIPVGRPFLDYVISALADAGIRDVCLVIGPEHQRVRDYYGGVDLTRVAVHFAVQERARGTADAVLAAEAFADGDHVLVVNSDNYYPVHTLSALRELGDAGLAAFERDALVRRGNIPADRVAQFSVVEIDQDGMLERIIEKPGAAAITSLVGDVFVGMNSWSLPPEIYHACRSIDPSPRGELELPDAVQFAHAMMGVQFHVLEFHDGVLDLSTQADIAAAAERLRGVEPRL